jgi:hypothetical protein
MIAKDKHFDLFVLGINENEKGFKRDTLWQLDKLFE